MARSMQLVMLLVLVTGCDVIFKLEVSPDTILLRDTFSTSVIQTQEISLVASPKVEPGDLLIAAIQAENTDVINMNPSAEWTVFADTPANSCSAQWHVWYARAVAAADTHYDFVIDRRDDISVVVTAYQNATTAKLVDLEAPGTTSDTRTLTFAPTTIDPRSVIWLGAAADRTWQSMNDPGGTARLDAINHLAVYDLSVASGEVPPIDVFLEIGRCVGIAQVRVEH